MNNFLLPYEDYVELSEIKNKTTYLMATSQVDIKILMWSIFSLLLRGNSKYVEHFIIAINGPHKKTGNPEYQDIKQRFFESLRDDYETPISIIRLIGQQGHTNSIDGCIPWVHTEYYTLVHDDIILLKDWTQQLELFSLDPKRSLMGVPPLLINHKFKCKFQNRPRLSLPHLNSCFLHVKKSVINKNWHGHHVKKDINFNKESYEKFIEFHKNFNYIHEIEQKDNFEYINTDVGSWVWYDLCSRGYNFYLFDPATCHHISMASWSNELNLAVSLSKCSSIIVDLENDINHSKYKDIYAEYSRYSGIDMR
jgi:hypothetical protein